MVTAAGIEAVSRVVPWGVAVWRLEARGGRVDIESSQVKAFKRACSCGHAPYIFLSESGTSVN